MGANVQFLDIIFFALVAAFVIFRLSRTLGSRPDNTRVGPNRGDNADSGDNVVNMLNRDIPEIESPSDDAPDTDDTDDAIGVLRHAKRKRAGTASASRAGLSP